MNGHTGGPGVRSRPAMSLSDGFPAGNERDDVHKGRIARQSGSLNSLDRAHERKAKYRDRLVSRPVEGEPGMAMEDSVRRALKLFHRQNAHTLRHRSDRPGNGIEQEIPLIQANPEAQDDRVSHRWMGCAAGDLE